MNETLPISRAPGLRLATFNVLFGHADHGPGSWSERRPLLRRAIESARPDILALQEVLPSKLKDVAEDLGDLALIPGPVTGPPRWGDVSLPFELVITARRRGSRSRRSRRSNARPDFDRDLCPMARRKSS